MTAYNKLIAALVSVFLMRLLLQWTGLDAAALGVGDQFRDLVSLGVDAVAAAVTGFFVWLVPNIKRGVNELERRL